MTLRLLPKERSFIAGEQAREAARELIAVTLEGASVTFTDAAQVRCPACGHDIDAWFTEFFDRCARGAAPGYESDTPCCGRRLGIGAFTGTAKFPTGQAKFALDVRVPHSPRFLTHEELAGLEQILGCPLTQHLSSGGS